MRKTIYVHVGAHRTGTSAAQARLEASRDALAAAGWLYPRSGLQHYGHHRLAKALRGRGIRSGDDGPEALDVAVEIGALAAEIAGAPQTRAVISSEGFFALGSPSIELFAAGLAAFDVRIVAVVRRPDELFQSICGNRARRARMRLSHGYAPFVGAPEHLSKDLDFAGALRRWSDVLGRAALRVGRYESETDSATLLAGLIGLPTGLLAGAPLRRNDSLSARATALLVEAKKAGLPERQLDRIRAVIEVRHPVGAERTSLLSPAERMTILEACAAGTDEVFAR